MIATAVKHPGVRKSQQSKLTLTIHSNFSLIGIRSDEPIYRLCMEINDRLKINLTCEQELLYFHPKLKEKIDFAVFSYDDEHTMRIRVIANHNQGIPLFDELKQFDYLLQLDEEWEKGELAYIQYCIKKSGCVDFIGIIDTKHLKNKNKIYF
jgi:hypothetical protein